MGRQIFLTMFGLLAAIAIGTTAWDLGAGEDIFWGLPSWIGLILIAFAAWWFPQTIIQTLRQPAAGELAKREVRVSSSLLSGVPVIVALALVLLGRVFGS